MFVFIEWQLECSYNMTFNGTTGPKESRTGLLIYDVDSLIITENILHSNWTKQNARLYFIQIQQKTPDW